MLLRDNQISWGKNLMISQSSALKFSLHLLVGCMIAFGTATAKDQGNTKQKPRVSRLAAPDVQERVHKTGNMHFMITNYGMFGNQADASVIDPETGMSGASCQFPAGSGIEYLFFGSLWMGAVVDGDTLTSTGHDGWYNVQEMFPDVGTTSNITKRSALPASPFYHPDAVSEADYIATFYDTLTNVQFVSPDHEDDRPHRPLGLKFVQESYSWSANGLDNFVIVKERLINIGPDQLHGLCTGLFFDCDVGHPASYNFFYDDITGSLTVPADVAGGETVAGWIADNDGDPRFGAFDSRSPRAAFGIAVIDRPIDSDLNYNWWVSNGDPFLDWGPNHVGESWPMATGGTGTPAGDRNKYVLMRRQSRDYDQLWAAVNLSTFGWNPPLADLSYMANIADGQDTKFLLSFELGDLAPGDSCEFVFAIAMGDNIHRNPQDFASLFSAQNPGPFSNALDLSNLRQTIQRARLQYRLVTTGLLGDSNSDQMVSISDAVYLIQYIFSGGPAPLYPNAADVNADCTISLLDVVYIVNFVFAGGPYPLQGCAAKL